MKVEIRIYKRFDIDLLTMCVAGYPVANMMINALSAYAHGTPLHYYIDEPIPFEPGKETIRLKLYIPNEDVLTIQMLKGIRNGYKNNFCKTILRNAFIQQSVSFYFMDPAMQVLITENLENMPINNFSNVKLCSKLREDYKKDFEEKKKEAGDYTAAINKQKSGRKKKSGEQNKAGFSPYPQYPPYPMQAYPGYPYPAMPGMMGQQVPPYMYPQQQMPAQYGQPAAPVSPQSPSDEYENTTIDAAKIEDVNNIDIEKTTTPENTSSAPPPDGDKIMALFDRL